MFPITGGTQVHLDLDLGSEFRSTYPAEVTMWMILGLHASTSIISTGIGAVRSTNKVYRRFKNKIDKETGNCEFSEDLFTRELCGKPDSAEACKERG